MIKLNWLFLAFALIVAACSPMGTEEPTENLDRNAGAASINVNETCGGSTSYGLFAGNTQDNVGEVKVSNDETNLYVQIFAASGTTFQSSHLNISCDVPTERGAPGQYNFNESIDPSSNDTYRKYVVALSALPNCGDPNCLNLLVHVATGAGETAFGGTDGNFNSAGGGGSWFNFINYCVQKCYEASGIVSKQNCDEEPIPYGGVTVAITQGDKTKSTTSDPDGSYSFTKLGEGDYTISVAGATPASITTSGNTSNNNFVINFYSISGTANIADCGTITGPLAGATVTLSGAATGSTTTDETGAFTFDWLTNGDYTVSIEGVGSAPVTLEGECKGDVVITKNLYSISGVVYEKDCDGNLTTTALDGKTVTLSYGDVTTTAITANGGAYSFPGLAEGSYTVTVTGGTSQSLTTIASCPSEVNLSVKKADCKCYAAKNETAWAAGSKYNRKGGNWATFVTYNGGSQFAELLAGQTMDAGDVNLARNGDGTVTIKITLAEGWTSGTVHIQGYNTAPSGNPSPGLFTTATGTQLTYTVPYSKYYGIHVEVSHQVEVPCTL